MWLGGTEVARRLAQEKVSRDDALAKLADAEKSANSAKARLEALQEEKRMAASEADREVCAHDPKACSAAGSAGNHCTLCGVGDLHAGGRHSHARAEA
jgi:hypothetical protein